MVSTRTLRPAVLKERLKAAARVRVRSWVVGDDVVFPDDPRQRLTVHPTSWAPVQLVQFGPDDGFPVTIGKYCAMHPSVTVLHGGNHRTDWVGVQNTRWDNGNWTTAPGGAPVSRGPVVIGNDVWVGFQALIMSGVEIGDGAVVGARATVTKSVQPYEIVGGTPARHLGWRFDEATRAALLRIRWWDWPEERVREHYADIDSPDVDAFVARFGSAS